MKLELVEHLMSLALEQARLAVLVGEVPVGAVVAIENEIVASAHNLVESRQDATMHAEVVALREASLKLGSWRLTKATLCVTLEPCSMCIGASKLARVQTLIFGADDPEKGACGSLFDLSQDARVGPIPNMITGIRQSDCAQILKDFFKSKRC